MRKIAFVPSSGAFCFGAVPCVDNHYNRGFCIIIPAIENFAQFLIVLVVVTAAIIIVKRDILSLVKTYALQSFLLALIAILFFIETGSYTPLYLAIVTFVSKIMIIPTFMKHILKKLNVKRDADFHFLSPNQSLIVSVIIIIFVYVSFTPLLEPLGLSNLFFIGATVGVSLLFIGMLVIFTRKQTITNIVGYLIMENGVLLFSLFLTELPLMFEILIVIDLIILTLLAAILAFGIDSSIEEFHARLNPFQNGWRVFGDDEDDELLELEVEKTLEDKKQ
ncbi:MAG: hydrogenase subunit [Candidatus Bathyarchaeia archaeon]